MTNSTPLKVDRLEEQGRNRSRRWIIRVSKEEDSQARQHAKRAGVGLSAWIRRGAAPVRVNVPTVPVAPLQDAVTAINRAGNNVNQQMAIAHTEGRIHPELIRLDAKLEAAIDLLLEALGRKA